MTKSLSGYDSILDELSSHSSSLANMTNKIQSFLSVVKYGADPSGTNDSTTAFQNTVNAARTTMINNNLQNGVIVVIPAGIYTLSGQIVISPFVHLVTEGFVLIQSSVASGSTIIFTAQSGDPTFSSLMGKQQYLRSPLINASQGGMLLKSTLNKTTGTIGLEIGSETDLGASLPTSRYSLCDIAIEYFDVAVQMNINHNYIGTFNNLHLEDNNTLMRFGAAITTVNDSGENFNFHGGVFGSANIGFDWYTDGFDCNFYGCSFDYITTVFNFRRGYKKVSVFGGHMEGMTTLGDGSNLQGGDAYPQLYLNNPVVLSNSTTLFKGNYQLECDNVKWELANSTLNSFLYRAASSVIARETNHITQDYDLALSPNLNVINNSKFQSANLGSGDAALPVNEYSVTNGGFNAPVITATIPSGSSYTRALKAVSNAGSGTWLLITSSNGYSCQAGDVIQMGAVIYIQAAAMRGVSLRADFYDILGNKISSSSDYANTTGANASAWNTLFGTNNIIAPAGTATVKLNCTISGLITNEIAYVGELFLGIS